MPLYDLYCTNCEKEYSIMASMADKTDHLIPCPDCGTTDLETVYNSAPAFLKGGREKAPVCPNSSVCGSGSCRFAG